MDWKDELKEIMNRCDWVAKKIRKEPFDKIENKIILPTLKEIKKELESYKVDCNILPGNSNGKLVINVDNKQIYEMVYTGGELVSSDVVCFTIEKNWSSQPKGDEVLKEMMKSKEMRDKFKEPVVISKNFDVNELTSEKILELFIYSIDDIDFVNLNWIALFE